MVFETRVRSTFMVAAALSIAGLALGACGGLEARSGASKGGGDQVPPGIDYGASIETASLSLLLVNAPSDALCMELAVFPAAAMSGGKTQLFDITPGSSPTLGMTGLPSGNGNLSARAFGVPCAQVQASTSPTWVSAGPVAVTLVAGQTLTTSIVLRKPSAIQVTATFDDGSLSLTPSVMDFGVTQVGGTATATFTVANPGTAAVTLPTPTLTGTDAGQFQVYQNSCGTSLPPGAACSVSVLFKPTSAGSKTATLNVATASAALSGTGLAGGLTITPNPVTFSSTPVGTTTSLTITLTNNAAIALSLGAWTITGASDFGLGTTTCGTSLAPASSCTHVITFSPLSGGSKTATLTNSAGASATLNGSAPLTAVYRINCGSNTVVSPFAADQYASGGTQHSVTNTINLSGVTNPAPQAVYQSERYGNTTYTFPGLTPSAQYTVRLHFAELYWTATGKRVFSVAINGSTVLTNFDIYASAGGNYKAVARDLAASATSSGQIVVKLTTVTDNASISGIEITPSCAPSCGGKCGGTDGCGGTCPNTCVAPQVCGGDNQCACPAGTCGSSCITCGGATPYCSAGQCVQCNSSSQCSAGRVCNSSGQCVCQGTSPGNLLTTPEFNTSSELSNWNANSGATWYAEDASGCPDSGSVLVNSDGAISQCIPATPGVKYFAGVRYKSSDSSTQASCYYDFRTPGCVDTTYITARFAGGPSTTWKTAVSEGDVAPAEAGAIQISCTTQGKSVLFDQFSVTTCPAGTCGSSCVTCGGATPNCLHGQCVQCNSSSQCSAGKVCNTSGQCVCRAKSAGNLLTSPGFETSSELFNWSPSGGVAWSAEDADGCPDSGSISVNGSNGAISQCIPVTPGSRYYVAVSYKSGDSSSQPSCYYDFRTFGCADTTYILARFAGGVSTTWRATTAVSDVAPAEAQTLQISCTTQGNSVLFDQFYVNVGSNTGY